MFLSLAVRFAFWALFGIVVLIVGSLLLIELGFIDWLARTVTGTSTDIRSQTGVRDLSESVKARKDQIDLAIKGIGLAFTVIIGTLTFLAGWYYAAFNLPLRLAEYLTHLRARHHYNRAVALAPYFSRNLRGDVVPVSRGYVSRVISIFTPNFFRARAIHRSLEKAEAVDADVGVLNESLRDTKSRRVTIHLLNGLRLAASARSMEPGGLQLERNEAAMEEFRKALALDLHDLDALEAAAKQSKLLNLNAEAVRHLERMAEAAANEAPVKLARALRYQAELLEERGTKAALKEARMKLDTALGLLSAQNDGADQSSPEQNEDKILELALTNEQLGSLHLKRGTPTLVEDYLDEGAKHFATAPDPEGPAGLARIEKLRELLKRALQGEDEVEEAESPITHVTIEIVDVFSEPGGIETPALQLPQFAGVGVLNDANGWAEIARGKQRPGYVESSKLRPLQ